MKGKVGNKRKLLMWSTAVLFVAVAVTFIAVTHVMAQESRSYG